MKILILYLAIFFTVFGSCTKDKISINETPDGLILVKMDTIIYSKITESFPDGESVFISHPGLFTDTVQKQIILTQESEVFVIFIAEGASYKNTLGWYAYPLGMVPVSATSLAKEIVFPNISGEGEGGLLTQGNMMQLGDKKFPAGTVIGFYLISNGWKDGSIAYDNPTFYTDYLYNTNSAQQHILFREKTSGSIVLGFEDSEFNKIETDKDFNDVLLNVTDNKSGYKIISFNMDKIPVF